VNGEKIPGWYFPVFLPYLISNDHLKPGDFPKHKFRKKAILAGKFSSELFRNICLRKISAEVSSALFPVSNIFQI